MLRKAGGACASVIPAEYFRDEIERERRRDRRRHLRLLPPRINSQRFAFNFNRRGEVGRSVFVRSFHTSVRFKENVFLLGFRCRV